MTNSSSQAHCLHCSCCWDVTNHYWLLSSKNTRNLSENHQKTIIPPGDETADKVAKHGLDLTQMVIHCEDYKLHMKNFICEAWQRDWNGYRKYVDQNTTSAQRIQITRISKYAWNHSFLVTHCTCLSYCYWMSSENVPKYMACDCDLQNTFWLNVETAQVEQRYYDAENITQLFQHVSATEFHDFFEK